ncbi:apolipoprotein N-acyltransferase [uncultured Pontibacter sp.]|uniref:apolipoprotein N-acyltransferase n=1 Tax=uncultured Pontibacter sp. TaxID=453356 RepID=UPI002622DB7E|nr:apolipoprotein N-acyltransferase [uncultured Pontibacter sp.]
MNITQYWSLSGKYSFARVVASAILFSLSLMFVNYVIAWFALLLLFISLFKVSGTQQAFRTGLLFGAVSAGILNYWMVPAIQYYAQSSLLLSVACWLLAVLLIALCYGFQFALYEKVRFQSGTWLALLMNAAWMAMLWVGMEWLRAIAFAGLPWLSYSFGVSISSQLYLVQPAAFGSVYILSFSLVLFNYILSYAIYSSNWKWIIAPLAIVGFHTLSGILLYQQISNSINKVSQRPVTTALVLAAQSPEAVWDERNGNALVQSLLTLNKKAASVDPDLVLWSETVVPWVYSPNDDFLRELSRELSGKKGHFMLGMSSPTAQGDPSVYNSAYLFKADGQLAGRYDKTELLTLVERPLFREESNIVLPFLAGGALTVKAGSSKQLMQTPWGEAGLLLCSESAVPALTNRYGQQGATFLVNLGNDGWFSDYFITEQHFYNARLRAVESRKDIVINNNRGISGVIHGSGDIGAQFQSQVADVQQVTFYPNALAAFNYQNFLYILFSLGVLLLLLRVMGSRTIT